MDITRMRGVNFGGWFSQQDAIRDKDPEAFLGTLGHLDTFLGAEDFLEVRQAGFDHVRLPVDWQHAFSADFSPREEVLSRLDRAVAQAAHAGLNLLLDLHRCPGHDFHGGVTIDQPLFTDALVLDSVRRVWAQLAERYGHHPHVILELLNEPTAPESATWNRIQRELWQEVRTHAPNAWILAASNRWNQSAEFTNLDILPDDRVIYSCHVYNPVLFTHQKAPWIANPVFHEPRSWPCTIVLPQGSTHRLPLEAGQWNRARLRQELLPVAEFRERHGVPVACNEFGCYKAGAKRSDQLAWLADVLSIFAELDIGWTYWNWKNLDFGVRSVGESLFALDPAYDNPRRLDAELLSLLGAS